MSRVMEILRAEGLGAAFTQPGQPGWLPPSLHTTLPPSSGSSESADRGELFSQSALLQSNGSGESGDHGCSSIKHGPAVNLPKASLFGVPAAPAPAEEMTDTNKRRVLYASPKVVFELSKKYAMCALEHYNKRKKIKFELVDIMPVNNMPEASNFYAHVNFTARSSKQSSQEELFFAELQLCSKRRVSSGFLVTCCEPLGPDYTVGHKGFQLADGSAVRKNIDFTRCFACGPRMFHPKGEKYIAGHCNIPYIYNSPY